MKIERLIEALKRQINIETVKNWKAFKDHNYTIKEIQTIFKNKNNKNQIYWGITSVTIPSFIVAKCLKTNGNLEYLNEQIERHKQLLNELIKSVNIKDLQSRKFAIFKLQNVLYQTSNSTEPIKLNNAYELEQESKKRENSLSTDEIYKLNNFFNKQIATFNMNLLKATKAQKSIIEKSTENFVNNNELINIIYKDHDFLTKLNEEEITLEPKVIDSLRVELIRQLTLINAFYSPSSSSNYRKTIILLVNNILLETKNKIYNTYELLGLYDGVYVMSLAYENGIKLSPLEAEELCTNLNNLLIHITMDIGTKKM